MPLGVKEDRSDFIVSKIENAQPIQAEDGNPVLEVSGQLFSPVEQIAFIKFGVPGQPLVTAERFALAEVLGEWPDAVDAKTAGFRVRIPLESPVAPVLSLQMVATFVDGFEVVGSFLGNYSINPGRRFKRQ